MIKKSSQQVYARAEEMIPELCSPCRIMNRARGVIEMNPQHSTLRRYIEELGPYQSLVLLASPVSLVEPLKFAAVAIAGAGHWMTGTITIVFAYVVSLFVVERLFKIVKPKLLTLPWFARLWNWFIALRGRVLGWFR
jgi:uncharacterized membrane protein SirB2